MADLGPLQDVEVGRRSYDGEILLIWGTCPGCGLRGQIDEDQYAGRVSVDCPECEYHETHDHREG